MTISELAKMAGVSVSTVSKVLNHKDNSISHATRKKILDLAKEYHCTPPAASSDRIRRTLTLGVLLHSSNNIDKTFSGMLDAAQDRGYTLLIRESEEDSEVEYKNLSALLSYNVDGILWEPLSEESLGHLELLEAQDMPYVIFNSDTEDAYNLDYKSMGYHAASVLIQHGHRDIACLLANGKRTKAFAEGYKQCLFDNQLPLNDELIFTEINDSLRRKIANHTISGIIVSHFKVATELYEEVHSLYYELPYDLSMISLKDAGRSELNFPKISTITIPHYNYGDYLCRKLIGLAERSDDKLPRAFEQSISLDSMDTVGIPYNNHSKRVVVVGSINIDNYLNVDSLPYSGKTVKSFISSSYAGGKGLNTAAGIAKLGHQVSLIGNTGNDAESDMIFSALNTFHINPSGVKRCQHSKTGQAHIFVQPDGDSMITIMSGANNLLSPRDVEANAQLFDNASYCIMNTEIPIETLIAAAELAHRRHITTILKPATSGVLPGELLKLIDIIVPNESELRDICPEGPSHQADTDIGELSSYLLSQGVGTVIVTLGERGCLVKDKENEAHYPAQDFDPIDSSGACDAFISALVSYLLYGQSLDNAIRISHYAAGFSVTRQGVIPSLVDKTTLESYIRRREPDLLDADAL